MTDVSGLDGATLARHLGNPEGDVGIAVADRMNQTNRALTEAVYRFMAPRAGDRVLEIGFGNGKLVPVLFAVERQLTYIGLDISQTMVDEAMAFNRALVEEGRATFRLASVGDIPFAVRSFERAAAINTIYFWPDSLRGLSEIRRVMRAGGTSVLAAVTPETAAESPYMRHGFRIYDEAKLRDLHQQAGFSRLEIERFRGTVPAPDGAMREREHYIVIARA
jgi:ubiquinone/menaquinone biosynthesis C-methylase UbiE